MTQLCKLKVKVTLHGILWLYKLKVKATLNSVAMQTQSNGHTPWNSVAMQTQSQGHTLWNSVARDMAVLQTAVLLKLYFFLWMLPHYGHSRRGHFCLFIEINSKILSKFDI